MTDSGRTPAPTGTTVLAERRMEIAFMAFRELHEHRWGAYAFLHTGDAEAAADITEAAFDRLCVQWPHALRQPSADSYAWSLLKEHVAGRPARHRRGTALATAAFHRAAHTPGPDRAERFRLLESRIALYAAIARLPERQCDALVLNLVIGYSVGQVADLLGVDRAAVRSLVGHAKRKVSAALSALEVQHCGLSGSEVQHSGRGK
ncbi:sigma-70 family RNA polymerase sigma factor [Streptomyces klenkii]|uniref:RNA polymerase sigma factor n=1 Tax=Streptomyces klenkii TaxID=1420899 RepID=UPI0033B3A688